MRWFLSFLGGVFLFVGAACGVAEVLLLTVGGADTLYSVDDLWTALRGGAAPSAQPVATEGWQAMLTAPLTWLLALPSWLVFLTLGGLLALTGGRGRERTFG